MGDSGLDELCGRVLGEYVLRERLDAGGFGTIYRCEQPTLGRDVVVKVLHQRLRRRDAAAQRFIREAQLASRLDHPSAAHVYAFGIEDDGLLWIAMERVAGVTLAAWLDTNGPMSLETLTPLIERIAEVVDAAHERGIVHRDLKPANIMVARRAGRLVPRLLDFGVAKSLGGPPLPESPLPSISDAEETTRRRRLRPGLTSTSIALGSPSYMAPEQWQAPESVGPAADIYALGVVVFEALTGRRPFASDATAVLGMMHCTAPVPVLGGAAAGLDPIFARALAKHPDARYATAAGLASALRGELEGRMLAAVRAAARRWHDRGRPSGLLWRDEAYAELERWRQRTGAGALARLEIEFAEASAVLADRDERRARRVRRGSVAAGIVAAAAVAGAFGARAFYATKEARDVAAATALDAEVEQGRAALLHDELPEAVEHLQAAVRLGDRSPATAVMLARAAQSRRAELARFPAVGGRMWSASFSPDGARVVTADDHAAQIWDVRTRQLLGTVSHDDTVYQALFTPDGSKVITAGGDGHVRIARAADGGPVRELARRGAALRYYRVAAAGDRVAAIDTAGAVVDVWSAATGALAAEIDAGPGRGWPALAWSPDGSRLATTGGDVVHVWNSDSLASSAVLPATGIRALAWSPDGARLLTGSTTGAAAIWSVAGERMVRLRDVGDAVDAVAWSPDGQRVALAARSGAVQVFTAAGVIVSNATALHGKFATVEFSPDGARIVAAGPGVAVLEVATGLPLAVLAPGAAVISAHFSADGEQVIGAARDGTARIWDAAPTYLRWRSPAASDDCGVVTSAAPDGRFIAVACGARPVRVWDTQRSTLVAELPASTVLPVVSPDGRRAAIAHGATAELYELPTGRLLHAETRAARVTAVALSTAGDLIAGDAVGVIATGAQDHGISAIDAVTTLPDGRIVATDAGQHLRVFDTRGNLLVTLPLLSRVSSLRISADGAEIVTVPAATASEPPELWSLTGPIRIAQLAGHGGRVFGARWYGDKLLTYGADGTVRMWDRNGSLFRMFHTPGVVFDAALSDDGAWLVGGLGEGWIRMWDVSTGRSVWGTMAHNAAVIGVHWDGEAIVTRGIGGDVARWTGIVAP